MNGIPARQAAMLAAIIAAMPLSIWAAIYPTNTWLQVGPVALAAVFVPALLRRWPISNGVAGCVTAFILLHLFAATWSYSFVPYDGWVRSLSGVDLHAALGWQRNMFDRLVHLLFGVLVVPVVSEVAVRHDGCSHRHALALAILAVLAVSCLYEVFEWALTMTLAPADAGAYNGEQGDPFDSQKDMAIAGFGSLLALPWARRRLHSSEF